MKPKPFSALNHFTVPTVISLSSLRHLGGTKQRPRPLAFAAGSRCCSRRPRREVGRDGPAEYLRGCSRGPNGGEPMRDKVGHCLQAAAHLEPYLRGDGSKI